MHRLRAGGYRAVFGPAQPLRRRDALRPRLWGAPALVPRGRGGHALPRVQVRDREEDEAVVCPRAHQGPAVGPT